MYGNHNSNSKKTSGKTSLTGKRSGSNYGLGLKGGGPRVKDKTLGKGHK